MSMNKVGCRALILSAGFKGNDYIASLRALAPELDGATPGALEGGAAAAARNRHPARRGEDRRRPEFRRCRRARLEGRSSPHSPRWRRRCSSTIAINIQFTSGTTGAPKGATLTHHNILNNGYFIGEAMRLSAADRLCIPVPYLSLLRHGARQSRLRHPRRLHGLPVRRASSRWRCWRRSRPSAAPACTASPTMFIAMLGHPEFARFDLSSLRTGIMAGSPCPVEVMRNVVARMHMSEVTIAYGMTETSPVSFQSACDDPQERRVSTVGRIQPHIEVKIVDGEGRIVPPGVHRRIADARL